VAVAASAASPAAAVSGTRERLVLADGVQLLGEYADSGFREPPLLARRGDGQMIKLTPLLHAVAAACDGRRDAEQVAAVVSEHTGRGVSAANVRQLAEGQLRPLGVLAQPDGSTPELPKRQALLSLRHRRPILRERAVNGIARAFAWLHAQPLKALLLTALLVFDAWLFAVHGIAGGIRDVLYEPAWLLAVLVSIVVATAFHEFGHASACRASGGRPGEMGVGVYLIWPAFYCDVTDAYRLDRRGRLRTDLGGVYFNGLFALGCGAAYFATGHEALLFAAFVQHMIMLQQLLPLLRFDGYYVLSDLTGVPDILSRVKPIFRSLVRGRRKEPKVAELKPWVRVAVTLYLLALIPALTFFIASIVLSAPRTFATAYDSFWLQLDRLHGSHGWAELGVGAFRIAALVMPLGAMSLSVSRSAKMGLRGVASWSRGSVVRRTAAFGGLAAVLGAVAFVWWPNGDYEPIRPGERGTIGELVDAVPEIPSGRPAFSAERASEFGSVPTARAVGAARIARGEDADPLTIPEPGAEPVPGEDLGDEVPGADTDDPGIDAGDDPGVDPGTDGTATPPPASMPGAGEPAPPAGTQPADESTPAPTGTAQPSPTATSTPSPSATPSPTGTPTPDSTGSATPDAGAVTDGSALATPDATAEGTPEATPTPTATP
jgi:putative peptide zinc metalloprotease protein